MTKEKTKQSYCERALSCCSCGGGDDENNDCGCRYCWDCNACNNCKEGKTENCQNE